MNKKAKITEKDKVSINNKEKKNELPKNKEKIPICTSETTKEQPAAGKEVKTTTVMSMLRAKRDALKSTTHINKGSKSTSSATSDDSSSSESDSSDTSSDADPRNSEDDQFDRMNNKVSDNKTNNAPAASVHNKINGMSSSNNIPAESDGKMKTDKPPLTTPDRQIASSIVSISTPERQNAPPLVSITLDDSPNSKSVRLQLIFLL